MPHRKNLLEKMRNARGRELPSFINFDLFTRLVCDVIGTWRKPAVALISAAVGSLKSTLSAAVTHTVPSVMEDLRAYLRDSLLQHVSKCEARVLVELDEELGPNGEQRAHTLNQYFTDELIKLRNRKKLART